MNYDVVLVRFKVNWKGRSNLCGDVIMDPLGRTRKIALPETFRTWSFESQKRVRTGEIWLCYVVRDTRPGDWQRGALIVEPLKQLDESFLRVRPVVQHNYITRNGARVRLSGDVYQELILDPRLIPFIESAIAHVDLPVAYDGGGSRFRQIQFKETVSDRLVFPAPVIGYAEKTTFAYFASGRAVRVNPEQKPEPTNTLTMKFRWHHRRTDRKRRGFHWRLAMISCHDISFPKPHEVTETYFWGTCARFWCEHAYAYDPSRMSPIITSSWREVSGLMPMRAGSSSPSLSLH